MLWYVRVMIIIVDLFTMQHSQLLLGRIREMIIEELADELLKLSDEDQAMVYDVVKQMANADGKVVELYTKTFIVHPETYTEMREALDALRSLSRVRGRDLRYGSEVREEDDGMWRIYELEYNEETGNEGGK